MRRVVPVILLCVLLPLHVVSLRSATWELKFQPKGNETAYAVPSPFLKIIALEFDGLASDFLFLRALTFIGSTLDRTETPRVKEWEWRQLYYDLTAATDLDPYFLDPYYFAQANLTWDGKLVLETNLLLDKGAQYRNWDWMLPFFEGFNYFYFLQRNDQASFYLMEASRRPGASPMVASLATRMAIKGKRSENAIVFLKEMLERENDETVRKGYQARLEALTGILELERAVALYLEQFKHLPASLENLVEEGFVTKMPVDPYGGEFFMGEDGSIGTTSELRFAKKPGTKP
jgi:hypothetical protein